MHLKKKFAKCVGRIKAIKRCKAKRGKPPKEERKRIIWGT